MIKKLLPISVFVLLLVIILLLGLQSMMNKGKQTGVSVTPTLIQGQYGSNRTSQTNSQAPAGSQNESYYRNVVSVRPTTDPALTQTPEGLFQNRQVLNEVRGLLPVVNNDFSAEYSSSLEKIIISKKTDNADTAINAWVTNNSIQDIVNNKDLAIVTTDSLDAYENKNISPEKLQQKQQIQSIVGFFNVLMSPLVIPSTTLSPIPSATPVPSASPVPKPTIKASTNTPKTDSGISGAPSGKYVYYSQCDGKFDNYPLPGGCNICKAGCGPTTVAMIEASYLDSSKTPASIVDDMKSKNMSIGCSGSGVYDMQTLIQSAQLTVSDYIIPKEGKLLAKDVVDDFKGYLQNGWTIFVLANFLPNGGGHYFWVTDVASNGDILAYDPYYGRFSARPFNENGYNPNKYSPPPPYYRYAFAVKKK